MHPFRGALNLYDIRLVAVEAPVVHNLPFLHLEIVDQQPISRRDLRLSRGFLTDWTGSVIGYLCTAGQGHHGRRQSLQLSRRRRRLCRLTTR